MPEQDNLISENLPEVKNFSPKSITEEINAEIQEELKSEIINDEQISEEPTELTDEEKRELLIKQIKESKKKFKPIKHPEMNGIPITNLTVNKYGTKFKKERKRKNKQAKKSRRTNRK